MLCAKAELHCPVLQWGVGEGWSTQSAELAYSGPIFLRHCKRGWFLLCCHCKEDEGCSRHVPQVPSKIHTPSSRHSPKPLFKKESGFRRPSRAAFPANLKAPADAGAARSPSHPSPRTPEPGMRIRPSSRPPSLHPSPLVTAVRPTGQPPSPHPSPAPTDRPRSRPPSPHPSQPIVAIQPAAGPLSPSPAPRSGTGGPPSRPPSPHPSQPVVAVRPESRPPSPHPSARPAPSRRSPHRASLAMCPLGPKGQIPMSPTLSSIC